MVISIDFDGTITKENLFPKIGELRKNAIEVIKNLQKHGHKCVLWTCREGKYLMEARNFLESKGLIMDGINTSPYDHINNGRKMIADLYIDDRNIFAGEIDWKRIENYILYSDNQYFEKIEELRKNYRQIIGKTCKKEFNNKKNGINFVFNKLSINKIGCIKSVKNSINNGFTPEEHFLIAEQIKEMFESSDVLEKSYGKGKSGAIETCYLCTKRIDDKKFALMKVVTWGANEGYIDLYLSKDGE